MPVEKSRKLTNNSPRDIILKLLEGLSNQDWDTVVNLYAENVIVHWPLAIPTPAIINGRKALQKTLQDGWTLLELRATDIRVHETHDPEIVIAEYTYNGKVRATGKVFRSANILVLTVRDGRIISARGYHNHVVAAAALGILDQIIPQLDINPVIDNKL